MKVNTNEQTDALYGKLCSLIWERNVLIERINIAKHDAWLADSVPDLKALLTNVLMQIEETSVKYRSIQ